MASKPTETTSTRAVGRDTIRSRLVLEVASEMVDQATGRTDKRGSACEFKARERWAVNMIASDGPAAIDLVARGEMQLAISNPSMFLSIAVRGTGPFPVPIPLRAITSFHRRTSWHSP